jgi:hypothetical protein
LTVSSTSNKIIYSGNGATTSFPFTFPGVAAADIQVFYTDAAGTITQIAQGSGATQCTVTLTAAVSPNPTGAGGSVTYPNSLSPIASGTFLTILRTMPLTQGTAFSNQGTVYPQVVEQALDQLLLQIQQINELIGRQITVAVSDSTPTALPPAAQRALTYMAFDTSGNPIAALASPGTTPVSSAMAAVVAAATLALARTAMGLGAASVEGIGAGLQDDGAANIRLNDSISTSDNTNQAVTSAFHADQRIATGPITYTLPRANTLWNGFRFRVENLAAGGLVTFAINVNDNFVGYSSGTSFIIGQGASLDLWTDAGASGIWYYRLQGGKTAKGDAAYTITPGDRTVVTNAALTASRTWTLPAANAFKPGEPLVIADENNGITSTNTLVVSRAGADTIVAQGTTINSITLSSAGDGVVLISDGASKWLIVALRKGPTVQRFTSGAAQTYTPAIGCKSIRVRIRAGGGGGGAVATNAGAVGVDSSFAPSGGSTWTAVHGNGGAANGGAGGAGGTGGTNGTGTLVNRADGQSGAVGQGAAAAGVNPVAGAGGGNGGGLSGAASAGGVAAKANTGGGGSGGISGANSTAGSGGGEGESVEFWMNTPVSATYTVGGGGNGGSAGTQAGGNGAAGIIIVEEFYA